MTFTKPDELREAEKSDKANAESAKNRPVLVKGLKVIVVTAKAIRFREPPEVCGDSLREVWVARSTILVVAWVSYLHNTQHAGLWVGDIVDITVPRWIADSKELCYD